MDKKHFRQKINEILGPKNLLSVDFLNSGKSVKKSTVEFFG